MLKIFKRHKDKQTPENVEQTPPAVDTVVAKSINDTPDTKASFLTRLKHGLKRTRSNLGDNLGRLLLGKKQIDAALFEEIETLLLQADIGVAAVQKIMNSLSESVKRQHLADGDALYLVLKQLLFDVLKPVSLPLSLTTVSHQPLVILMVGINGAGKTTTIGKLTKQFQNAGQSVMLAAGDTFRAAAVEQLQAWGQRNNVPVIAQHTGADSASVIFDAVQAAKARGCNVLIADTAGRLHTQQNLMDELKKIIRVIKKVDPSAPHEVMLVLDAGIGQNALQQALQFKQAVDVSGICMTKLDGTAKGGILFAIAEATNIPIRFIGVGEGIEDLRQFDAEQFIAALFAPTEEEK